MSGVRGFDTVDREHSQSGNPYGVEVGGFGGEIAWLPRQWDSFEAHRTQRDDATLAILATVTSRWQVPYPLIGPLPSRR